MRDIDIAWVAGLLEGEGSFTVLDIDKVRITCEMTDRDVVSRLRDLCGGSFVARDSRRENWKPTYFWAVYGQDALVLAELLLPFMGERRTQKIKEMIAVRQFFNQKQQEAKDNIKNAVEEYKAGNLSMRAVAKKYGIVHGTIKSNM